MKKTILVLAIVISILFFSCVKARKNMSDYFPKVETVVATVNSNGDVIVEGKIDLQGDSVLAVGFCVDTLPDPNLLRNQREFNLPVVQNFTTQYNNIDFKLSFKSFDRKKTYYFRSWAANRYGYSYGNSISLTNIKGTPVNPPCNLALGYVDLGQGAGNIAITSVGTAPANLWLTQVNFDLDRLWLNFEYKPVSRIYTSVESMNFDYTKANLSLNGRKIYGALIYAKETSDSTVEFTICNAIYYTPPSFNTTATLKARFSAKY